MSGEKYNEKHCNSPDPSAVVDSLTKFSDTKFRFGSSFSLDLLKLKSECNLSFRKKTKLVASR